MIEEIIKSKPYFIKCISISMGKIWFFKFVLNTFPLTFQSITCPLPLLS